MTADTHDAEFYVQLAPDFYKRPNGEHVVRGIRATALTQKRPQRQQSGTVLVKLTIRVPDAAFLPLRPEAIVVVPENMTAVAPIEVEAGDPGE